MAKTLRGRWVMRSFYVRDGCLWAHLRDALTERVHRFRTDSRDEAKAELAVERWIEAREKRERLEADRKAKPRTAYFGSTFVDWVRLKSCRQVTVTGYWIDLAGHYWPAFGAKTIDEILPSDVQRFLKGLQDKGRSVRTRRKHLIALRSFFRWARGEKLLAENPAAEVKAGKGADPKEAIPLTYSEAKKLLSAASKPTIHKIQDRRRRQGEQAWNPPAHAFLGVALGIYTGLRQRSLVSIRRHHIDLDARRIDLPGELMKAGRDHTVPIAAPLARLLEDRLRGMAPGELVLGAEIKTFRAALEGACRRAGIRMIGPHTLRHTLGTWLGHLNVPIHVVAAILGHADRGAKQGGFDPVTGRYLHAGFAERLVAVDRLPDLLGAQVVEASAV